jgi:hypothetical protein
MIVVKLNGGLGNQMFQYAVGRVLSIHNQTALFLDLSELKIENVNKTYRNYSLNHFKIQAQPASNNYKIAPENPTNWMRHFSFKQVLKPVMEKNLSFDPLLFSAGDNVYLDGYWQSPCYFEKHENAIRSDFTFTTPLPKSAATILERIKTSHAVSIHIRRGDYVSNPETNAYHGVCDLSYYKKSIALIQEKIAAPVFFIFTDDPQWVSNNFKLNDSFILVSQPGIFSQVDDLHLMSLCKDAIIANSSYSWWGAWLINRENKIIVAPEKWFQNEAINTSEICPPSWFRM